MRPDPVVNTVVIGCGGLGRNRMKEILSDFRNTNIPVVCEPSPDAYKLTADIFLSRNRNIPVNVMNLDALLNQLREKLQ